MDENILLNSLYKFANLGYYKHGWELPQLIKNARFLYRDYLTSEHIQLLTGFYNDFAKGHFSNTSNVPPSSAEQEGGEPIETEGEQLHF
ncbi:MAG: hypothetical protein J6T10_23980 [Methanobrevibacter sp.]|nr:hypothetical protein [Methanobrevibacter sp.]